MFETFLIGIGVFGVLFAFGVGAGWAMLCVVVLMWTARFLNARKRARLLSQFASGQGLASLGDRLPHLFPINNSATRSGRSIHKVFEGHPNGLEVLIFDCFMGQGRGRYGRTVVAVRGQLSDFGGARFGPDLKSEQVGEWALVFSSQRLMELEEITALVSESERTAVAGRQ